MARVYKSATGYASRDAAAPTWRYFGEGHLFIPTLVSLRAYFERVGLRIVREETHGVRGRFKAWRAFRAARTGRGHRVRCLVEKPANPA